MSDDKPQGDDKPKMKIPPLKKKHRLLGELPPGSLAAALNYRELAQQDGQEQAQGDDPAGDAPPPQTKPTT